MSMIPDAMYRWFFTWYFQRLAHKQFEHVAVRGAERLAPWDVSGVGNAALPLVIVANHSSWWDPVMAVLISRVLHSHTGVALQDAEPLEKYPFFRAFGSVSLDLKHPRTAYETIRQVADTVRDTRSVVWVFPQGKILPNDIRPLGLHSGIGRLVRFIGDCYLVPVAMRYEFLQTKSPSAFVSIGIAEQIREDKLHPKTITEMVEQRLCNEVDNLRRDILSGSTNDFNII